MGNLGVRTLNTGGIIKQIKQIKLIDNKQQIHKTYEKQKHLMNQLENNLQFFSNVADDNPMVLDVQKKIERHKTQLEQWTKKLSNIKRTIK